MEMMTMITKSTLAKYVKSNLPPESAESEWSVVGVAPTYRYIFKQARGMLGRPLGKDEKRICRDVYEDFFDAQDRKEASSSLFLILMAYSDDYAPGPICEALARKYCELHGHDFACIVAPASDMLAKISPRTNLTWFKIPLLQTYLKKEEYDYVVWVDADAAIVHPERDVFASLAKAYPDKDLIISEDLTPACLINCGVMMFRSTHWTKFIVDSVWNCHKRYHKVRQFEQSALQKLLVAREQLDQIADPFHSFRGGPGVKLTRRTAVLPRGVINTQVDSEASFIFHAIGSTRGDAKRVQILRQLEYK